MLSRRAQIGRLRRVAHAALERFPLPQGDLSFVTHGENTTFRHRSDTGDHLIRVHRPHRHGVGKDAAAAIRSELEWLRAIRADTDLEVPVPLAARDGALTVEVCSGGIVRTCSVLEWMSGRIHEDSARPVHLHRLGAAMARLHLQADAWTPPIGFTRIEWSHDTFFGDAMVYGDLRASECRELVPPSLRSRFDRIEDDMAAVMSAPGDVGLIHADLHLGNALFEGDRVKLIDFDDCGTGFRVYDLAVALWERRDEPDHEDFRSALLDGYRAVRDIDVTHLDDWIAVRQVAFDLWYTGTAQLNPAFAERLDIVHDWSAEMLGILGR
jgi:Ser/Thr protein kinase RdoA (MazF antagonist)